MNQNTRGLPRCPNLASASFADHKLRFNPRIIHREAESRRTYLVRRVCNEKFLLVEFFQIANETIHRRDAFRNSTYV
jgi:hypothetical protein